MITPYDWQQSIAQRAQYVEGRLAGGSPVVGLSFPQGVMLATVRGSVRKVYEVYDRLIFAGLGSQADLEALRLRAVEFAHTEGFVRSEADVTVQRVVGFALSPTLKRAFADPMTAPFVARALFAEMGDRQEHDAFYVLNFDGEYSPYQQHAVVAGGDRAEQAAISLLRETENPATAEEAARLALLAWGAAREVLDGGEQAQPGPEAAAGRLRKELESATPEIGCLDRESPRQNKFFLWPEDRVRSTIASLP